MLLQACSRPGRYWLTGSAWMFPEKHDCKQFDYFTAVTDNVTRSGRPSYTFALLQVCRQVNLEARHLPFKLNTFKPLSSAVLNVWIPTYGAQLKQVQTLRFCAKKPLKSDMCSVNYFRTKLSHFKDLRTLEIATFPILGWDISEDLAIATI
ncbi:hypothetical protein EK21DRAFT_106705 [Setomelanomma holmii]|uniref:Uncharacterized protein n=1 Tax=Setomelanomma holmii TaxID=210430 RepID=A0A9P4LRZ6_9PLEO|nr:hypothetical protein EK21DRAFT_106705 [Setomelanomma holmii]